MISLTLLLLLDAERILYLDRGRRLMGQFVRVFGYMSDRLGRSFNILNRKSFLVVMIVVGVFEPNYRHGRIWRLARSWHIK
jgi:hypothetical protein